MPFVMSLILFAILRIKIQWDKQLELIRRPKNTMGRAENILWTKEINYTRRKYVRMNEKWNKMRKMD
jgi:hypothetical protein